MTTKEQLHHLVEQLPEGLLPYAYEAIIRIMNGEIDEPSLKMNQHNRKCSPEDINKLIGTCCESFKDKTKLH